MNKVLTLLGAVNDALHCAMEADDSVIVYGEDVGLEGGVFRATENLQKRFGVMRCFDSPLAESAIAGTAVGMAAAGLKPVIEMQFSGFAWPAFNQIVSHIARYRNRTRSEFPMGIVIRMPYGGGIRALEHHSESMEAIWAHVPGLKVVIPSTPYDAKGLLLGAIADPDPVIFMEPKRVYRNIKQEVPERYYTLPIGKARILRPGRDLTLVSWGAQMKECREAGDTLSREGMDVEIIDLRSIYPFDKETIVDSVRKTGRFLVVHEAHRSFGVGAELVATAVKDAFYSLELPPQRLTAPDITVPLQRAEKLYMISADRIAERVRSMLREE